MNTFTIMGMIFGMAGFVFGIIGMSASSQITGLRTELATLKKNLKDSGIIMDKSRRIIGEGTLYKLTKLRAEFDSLKKSLGDAGSLQE